MLTLLWLSLAGFEGFDTEIMAVGTGVFGLIDLILVIAAALVIG